MNMITNKRFIRFAGWSLLVIIFIVSLGFASHKQNVMPCGGLEVSITDTSGHSFITEPEVRQFVHDRLGSLDGQTVGSINIAVLEKMINANPFIERAEVFSTVDGKVVVEVKQRDPVLRIINVNNESFYIDKEGIFMPLSSNYSARVPLANGFIFDRETERNVIRYTQEQRKDTTLKVNLIDKVFHIAEQIHNDEFWKAQIEQIYVNNKGEIELVPRVGNHIILIGDDTDLKEKLDKLLVFYREGLKMHGWSQYSMINLKFKDQVVCTKK